MSAAPVPDAPLLIVAVDRLPAWILSAYGATWTAQPALDAVAARGLVFDRVVTTTDDARRALADLLGPLRGLRPAVLVTDAGSGPPDWDGEVRTVPVRSDGGLEDDEATTNLGRLFAAAEAVVAREPWAGGRRLLVVEATSLGLSWDAPEMFRQAYVDPDDPPPPPGGFVPDFQADADTDPDLLVGIRHAFAGQLTLFDRCLGRLLAAAHAGAPGLGVLVVGLRGLGLGLHGRVGPGPLAPYGEIVHVPAILVEAGGRMAGQRYGGLATPGDLGETLASLTGVLASGSPGGPGGDEPWRGRSVAGLFERWEAPARDRVITAGVAGVAVTTLDWHAVRPAGTAAPPRLHAKPDDFFELCDVADRSPDVAAELGGLLEAVVDGRGPEAWRMPLSHA